MSDKIEKGLTYALILTQAVLVAAEPHCVVKVMKLSVLLLQMSLMARQRITNVG